VKPFSGGICCEVTRGLWWGFFFVTGVFFVLKGTVLAAWGKIKPSAAVQGEVTCPARGLGGPLCSGARTSLGRGGCVRRRTKRGEKACLLLRPAHLRRRRPFFRSSWCRGGSGAGFRRRSRVCWKVFGRHRWSSSLCGDERDVVLFSEALPPPWQRPGDGDTGIHALEMLCLETGSDWFQSGHFSVFPFHPPSLSLRRSHSSAAPWLRQRRITYFLAPLKLSDAAKTKHVEDLS